MGSHICPDCGGQVVAAPGVRHDCPVRERRAIEAREARMAAAAVDPIAAALRTLRRSLANLADTARDEVPEDVRRGKLNVAIANARSARGETNVAARMVGLADDE